MFSATLKDLASFGDMPLADSGDISRGQKRPWDNDDDPLDSPSPYVEFVPLSGTHFIPTPLANDVPTSQFPKDTYNDPYHNVVNGYGWAGMGFYPQLDMSNLFQGGILPFSQQMSPVGVVMPQDGEQWQYGHDFFSPPESIPGQYG